MRKVLTYIRWGSLAVVLIICSWLFWPERQEAAHEEGREVEYTIRFAPGQQYYPGSVPFGIGEPLEGLRDVIRDYEEENPHVRIRVVNVPGVREYLVTQLSSGQAPDIINVNVEDVWVDIHKGWYLPLDSFLEAPNPYIRDLGDPDVPGYDEWWDMFEYQAISRGKAAPDGKNYTITYDMIETGIFYNKDIFEEVGIEPPTDWEDWMESMARLDEAGYIPLLMVIDWFNGWASDLFFDQLYYDILPGIDLLQDPVREQYLEGYLDADEITFLFQKGFLTHDDPRYRDVWRIMHDFRQYCNQNISTFDPVREFVTQRGAMIWSSSLFAYRLAGDPQLEFDYGVFYLPRFTEETSEFASDVEMCVIGGSGTQLEVTNTAIGDTDPSLSMEERMAESERLREVMNFLHFITLPENYERIVNEYACMIPNIKGVEVLPPLKPFTEILERRYTTTKWVGKFDLRFTEIQRRSLELYLNDSIDLDSFMNWQVDNLRMATENHIMRKEDIDFETMEREWERRAPLRAEYEGMPFEQ